MAICKLHLDGACTKVPTCIGVCFYHREVSRETQTVAATLQERGSRYGDFTDNAVISQEIKDLLRSFGGWNQLDKTKREILDNISAKIARILNGDSNYKDNWHDIAGYATLAEERCTSSSFPPPIPSQEPKGDLEKETIRNFNILMESIFQDIRTVGEPIDSKAIYALHRKKSVENIDRTIEELNHRGKIKYVMLPEGSGFVPTEYIERDKRENRA